MKVRDRQSLNVMSFTWTHNVDVMKAICPRELLGRCVDKQCSWQHLGRMKLNEKGHALRIVDLIESFITENSKCDAEKHIVAAKLDIHTAGKAFEHIICNLLTSLYPVPSQSPFSFRLAPIDRSNP